MQLIITLHYLYNYVPFRNMTYITKFHHLNNPLNPYLNSFLVIKSKLFWLKQRDCYYYYLTFKVQFQHLKISDDFHSNILLVNQYTILPSNIHIKVLKRNIGNQWTFFLKKSFIKFS